MDRWNWVKQTCDIREEGRDIRGLDSGQGFEGGRTGEIKRTGR